MPATALIQPDTAFIKDLLASGGSDLKKCFQCATCSAICAQESVGKPDRRGWWTALILELAGRYPFAISAHVGKLFLLMLFVF